MIKFIIYLFIYVYVTKNFNLIFFSDVNLEIGDINKPLFESINNKYLLNYLTELPINMEDELKFLNLSKESIIILLNKLSLDIIYHYEFNDNVLKLLFEELRTELSSEEFLQVKKLIELSAKNNNIPITDSLVEYNYRL